MFFPCVFFHVDSCYADLPDLSVNNDLQRPMLANWKLVLAYLVSLRQVWIEIILPCEPAVIEILQLVARPVLIANSNTFLFKTGRTPGMPMHMGHVCVFGSEPNLVEHPQKIFVSVSICAWTCKAYDRFVFHKFSKILDTLFILPILPESLIINLFP